MSNITDNKFSESFINSMVQHNKKKRQQAMCKNVSFIATNKSQQEIINCWNAKVPYFYKNRQTDRPTLFIRANSDGSEDLVRLVIPANALSAADIEYKLIRTLYGAYRGWLYHRIYSRKSDFRKRNQTKMLPTACK